MKRFLWMLVCLGLTGCRRNGFTELKVANAVEPLLHEVVSSVCHSPRGFQEGNGWAKGAKLIFKEVRPNPKAMINCIEGHPQMEYFARCYDWAWSIDKNSIGRPSRSFGEKEHLFYRPTKDIDLGVFTCTNVDLWPYRDRRLETMEIGKIYEVQ